MEILNRREQVAAKKLPPVIGDDVEKASKSKFGVVKIGDGINVSSGVISVPAGGVTCDELWTGTTSTTVADITESLAHPLSDYKLLLCYTKGTNQSDAGLILPYLGVTVHKFALTKTIDLNVTETVVTIKNESSGSFAGVTLVGIK